MAWDWIDERQADAQAAHDAAELAAYERESEEEMAARAEEQTAASPLDGIVAYEQGDLTDDEALDLFQELVDSGLAWSLQGSYGRTAAALIDAGLVTE